jgi:hypothetical protein
MLKPEVLPLSGRQFLTRLVEFSKFYKSGAKKNTGMLKIAKKGDEVPFGCDYSVRKTKCGDRTGHLILTFNNVCILLVDLSTLMLI